MNPEFRKSAPLNEDERCNIKQKMSESQIDIQSKSRDGVVRAINASELISSENLLQN